VEIIGLANLLELDTGVAGVGVGVMDGKVAVACEAGTAPAASDVNRLVNTTASSKTIMYVQRAEPHLGKGRCGG